MSKEKLYFRSIDDNICRPLNWHMDDARDEELNEITLCEAIPDNDNPDYIWCTHYKIQKKKINVENLFVLLILQQVVEEFVSIEVIYTLLEKK